VNRVVFVESNTTGTGMLALRRARELGLQPCFVTRSPGRYPRLDAEVQVCDTNDVDRLPGAIRARWPEGIVGVTTTSEFYLPAVARVAAEMGLPGNREPAMWTCRNKAAVRDALSRNGIGQPRYAVVRTPGQVDRALDAVGLPCVVKPLDGSGSQNVGLCSGTADVDRLVRRILATRTNVRGQPSPHAALIEEFVPGPEYSVETVSHDGTVTCIGITAKTLGPPPDFVELRHLYPAPIPSTVDDELRATVERTLKTLGVTHGPAHTEVRWTPAGPVVIEVNARLAGGMIPELVRLVDGVDLLVAQLNGAVGRPVRLPTRHRGVAGIRFLTAGRAGILRAVHGVDRAAAVPRVRQVQVTAAPGDRVAPARDAYGRLGFVIAEAATAADVEQALDRAVADIAWEVDPE
jgi:cysteine synthase A